MALPLSMILLTMFHFFPHKAMASIMYSASCCAVSGLLVWYTLDSMQAGRKKFNGFMSSDTIDLSIFCINFLSSMPKCADAPPCCTYLQSLPATGTHPYHITIVLHFLENSCSKQCLNFPRYSMGLSR